METPHKTSNQKKRHPFIQELIDLHNKLALWQAKLWRDHPYKASFLQEDNRLIHADPSAPPLDIIPKSHKELTSWAHDPMNPASPESFAAKLSDGTYIGNVHPADPTLNTRQFD